MDDAEFFVVTRVHRDDLAGLFSAKQVALLTDADLAEIAEDMGDAYCTSGAFWSDLAYFTAAVLAAKKRRAKAAQG